MAHFLAHRPEPENITLSVFVSTDRGALNQVRAAAKAAPGTGSGKVQVHALHRDEFRNMLRNLVREVERSHPQCRDIPFPAIASSFLERVTQSQPSGKGHVPQR